MRAAVALATLLALAGTAAAIEREGAVASVGLGPGGVGANLAASEDRENGIAFELRLGGMITRRLALLATLSYLSGTTDGDKWEHGVLGTAARFFVNDVFWLEAGLGSGDVYAPGGDATSGLAVTGALGVDIVRAKTFAIAVELHGTAVGYEGDDSSATTSLTVAITWY
jgi:hypothetical protein